MTLQSDQPEHAQRFIDERVHVAQYSAEPILSEDGSRPRILAEPLLVDGRLSRAGRRS